MTASIVNDLNAVCADLKYWSHGLFVGESLATIQSLALKSGN
jgi:hypothetical protein